MNEQKMAEYSALKQEQSNRILLREAALHVNIVLTITAVGVFLNSDHFEQVWLVIPLLNLSVFWIYFNNDHYISQIRTYIRSTLGGSAEDPTFAWEIAYKKKSFSRYLRGFCGLLAVLTVFFGPSGYCIIKSVPVELNADFETTAWVGVAMLYCIGLLGAFSQSSLIKDVFFT